MRVVITRVVPLFVEKSHRRSPARSSHAWAVRTARSVSRWWRWSCADSLMDEVLASNRAAAFSGPGVARWGADLTKGPRGSIAPSTSRGGR